MATASVMERYPCPRLVQFCTPQLDVEAQANVCGETPDSFFGILRILFIPQIQPEVRLLEGA